MTLETAQKALGAVEMLAKFTTDPQRRQAHLDRAQRIRSIIKYIWKVDA